MYEVELKLPADHDAVRERLAAIGAEHRGTVRQRDTYHDHPGRDLAETGEALRVRRVERNDTTETRLTYKGPLVDDVSKTREEHETRIADGAALASALEALGFDPVATVTKTREEFELDDHLVTLDDVEGLGEFVEVEREVADGIEAAREAAVAVVERLGLDPEDGIRTSYLELLAEERAGSDDVDGVGR